MSVTVEAHEHRSQHPRCPYCHDDVRAGQSTWKCPSCEAAYHEECVRDLGHCAVMGCETVFPRQLMPHRHWLGGGRREHMVPACHRCHGALDPLPTWRCPACETSYHEACVSDGRCTVEGCTGTVEPLGLAERLAALLVSFLLASLAFGVIGLGLSDTGRHGHGIGLLGGLGVVLVVLALRSFLYGLGIRDVMLLPEALGPRVTVTRERNASPVSGRASL